MTWDFDHGLSRGRMDADNGCWSLVGGSPCPFESGTLPWPLARVTVWSVFSVKTPDQARQTH